MAACPRSLELRKELVVIGPELVIRQSFEEACMGFASSFVSGELAAGLQPWGTFDATFVKQTIAIVTTLIVIHFEEFTVYSFQFKQQIRLEL
jgi:hypothetical protein